jgi:uncharacterized repeat protein (TIGR01451 family)
MSAQPDDEPSEILSLAAPGSGPSDYEQYLLELINRARSDPASEAARYGIDLNEGLSPGTISSDPKQPLAINPNLVEAARAHSQWMIDNDVFSHTGANGSTPYDRMAAAGYVFLSPWSWGENIAWSGTTSTSLPSLSTTADLHENLFVDTGVSGRGHRLNLMNPSFREIGPGIALGVFSGYNAEMVTEDFAYTATPGYDAFLTGVVYDDLVSPDSFYTPGEGLGDVTITARRTSDGVTFSTATWSSGGYSLALPTGTYNVTASGGGLQTVIAVQALQIGSANVKVDFTPDETPLPADLTVSASHSGDFQQGDAGVAYTITVTNVGAGATTGAVTVQDTLPTGLTPTAANNGTIDGWSVSTTGQTVTATRSDALAGGASYPALTITVDVAPDAPASVSNAAIVSGGGETNTANNTASDPTSITLAVLSPVYRFWSDTLQGHFYTISTRERDKLIASWSSVWTYEGIAYYAYASGESPAGTTAVYRFWSPTLQGHFYTASPAERDKLIVNWSDDWSYEGIAYYVYATGPQPVGTLPVYRFWSPTFRHHFYTISVSERDALIAQWSQTWIYEGPVWYMSAA